MSGIEIGSEWVWTNNDGEVEVWVIDVATNEHGETLITTEEADGEIQYDDMDYFLANYKPKADMVNHPPHYKDESGIECIEVTKHMSFLGGNCFKYLYRAGSKGDAIEDLKKAAWYAERACELGENLNQEARDKIREVRRYRELGIQNAMRAMCFSNWMLVIEWIELEVKRLEGAKNLGGSCYVYKAKQPTWEE